MNASTLKPSEARFLLLKHGCSFPPPTVEVVKPKKPMGQWRKNHRGKNIQTTLKWIATRNQPFSYVDLRSNTNLDNNAAKYCLWRLEEDGAIEMVPKGQFETCNVPRKYVRKNK